MTSWLLSAHQTPSKVEPISEKKTKKKKKKEKEKKKTELSPKKVYQFSLKCTMLTILPVQSVHLMKISL